MLQHGGAAQFELVGFDAVASQARLDARAPIDGRGAAVDHHQVLAGDPTHLVTRDAHGVGPQQGDLHIPLQLDGLAITDHRAAAGADRDVGAALFVDGAAGLTSLGQLANDVVAGLWAQQLPGGGSQGIALPQVQGSEHKGLLRWWGLGGRGAAHQAGGQGTQAQQAEGGGAHHRGSSSSRRAITGEGSGRDAPDCSPPQHKR